MTKYKIEVSRIDDPKPEERYGNSTTIYSQTVDGLNLPAIVAVVNGLGGSVPPPSATSTQGGDVK